MIYIHIYVYVCVCLIWHFKHCSVDRNILAVTKFIILLKVEFDELLEAGLLNYPFMAFSMTPAMNALSLRQYSQKCDSLLMKTCIVMWLHSTSFHLEVRKPFYSLVDLYGLRIS